MKSSGGVGRGQGATRSVTTDADFALLSRRLGWPPKVIHLEECDFPLRIIRIIEEVLRRNSSGFRNLRGIRVRACWPNASVRQGFPMRRLYGSDIREGRA